jgi:hypothetical protein
VRFSLTDSFPLPIYPSILLLSLHLHGTPPRSIPEIFQTLCEELALTRPDDPLAYMAHSFASAQYIDLAAARCTSIADAADPLTYAPDELSTAADGTLVSVSRGGGGDAGDADGESANATHLSTPFPSSLPAPYFSQGAANTNASVASHRAESGLRAIPSVPAAVLAATPRHSNANSSFASSSSSSSTSTSASSPRAVAFGIDLSATLSGQSSGGSGISGSSGDSISMHTMRALLEANTRIGAALDPYRATAAIVDECCRLCDCERATIFLVNETRRELEVWCFYSFLSENEWRTSVADPHKYSSCSSQNVILIFPSFFIRHFFCAHTDSKCAYLLSQSPPRFLNRCAWPRASRRYFCRSVRALPATARSRACRCSCRTPMQARVWWWWSKMGAHDVCFDRAKNVKNVSLDT